MHPEQILAACTALVGQVIKFDHPADAVVSRFFKDNRNLGPRERATLAETAYNVLRKKALYDAFALGAPKGSGARERKLAILGFFGPRDFKADVLKLGFDGIKPQPMGERCVDIIGFCRDFQLFVLRHAFDGAQVVQPVGHFDEYDADVGEHRGEYFFEILGLRAFRIVEAVELGEAVHDFGDFGAKTLLNFVERHVGIFHHVVQKGANDRRRAEADFLHANAGHLDGVQNVRLARLAPLLAVRLDGHLVGESNLRAVFRRKRGFQAAQKAPIGPLNEHFILIVWYQNVRCHGS